MISVTKHRLPAVNSNGSDAGLLNPPDQTDRVLQLKPAKNTKPVTAEDTGDPAKLPAFKRLINLPRLDVVKERRLC